MSIISAMFAGVSGLLANAEGINVIGNNLANVNTVGFKGSRMLFSDMLSVNIGNDSQIGRGTQIQKVDNIFSQGSFETTDNITDLSIQGNSFFAVKDPNVLAPVVQNSAMLTRAGAFRVDKNLNLVTPDNFQVLDTAGNPIVFSANKADIDTANTAVSTAYSTPAGVISAQAAAQLTATTTFTNTIFTAAAGVFNTQAGNALTAANTLKGVTDAAGTGAEKAAVSQIVTAATNYQAATTTANTNPTSTNIAAAQTAYTNLATVTTNYAASFTTNSAAYTTFNTALAGVNAANALAAPPADIASAIAIQNAATTASTASTSALANPSAINNSVAQTDFNDINTLVNNSSINVSSIPAFVTAYNNFKPSMNTANTTVDVAMNTAEPVISAALAQLATAKSVAFGKITSIDSSGLITFLGQDGATLNYYNASGQVGAGTTVANSGTVQRLAVIQVPNLNGLEKAVGSLYKPTPDSGVPNTAFNLSSNSANGTSEKIYTNSLEQSNVDMAAQFVKMILTQRAYSANSKTITTADEMTQEVLGLKR